MGLFAIGICYEHVGMLFGYMAVVQMAAFCRHRTCRLCSLTGEDT